jgi:hypothetical protein
MELNFSELDNNNINTKNPYESFNYNNYETNPEKYWEQKPAQKNTQPKKKKVSFDDILSNMNLVVNQSGVLQFMQPTQTNEIQDEEQYYQNQYQYQQNEYQQNQYQQNQYQQNQYQEPIKVKKTQEPLDPSVKHSYIYNKYFKDYQDANPKAPEVRVPKTMEEYQQMLLEDRIKQIEQRKRISQIKSTKLMFVSNQENYGNQVNPRNIIASKNNLRMMNFR